MAIGRTFPESLQKGVRSLETGRLGLNCDPARAQLDASTTTSSSSGPPSHPRAALPARGGAARGRTSSELAESTGSTRGSSTRSSDHRRARPPRLEAGSRWTAAMAPGQAPRLLRRPARLALGRRPRPTCRRPARGRRAGHVQDRRHLRRRVRARRRPTTTRPTRTRTRCDRVQPAGRHPRFGAQPHRAGHRVRLLLRARRVRPARRRLRDRDGQLQPRDRLDRLRHQRPPLLRAADDGGRAQRHRRRAADGVIVGAGRPDAAQARRPLPPGPMARHQPRRDRPGRGPRAVERPVRPARRSPSRRAARPPPSSRGLRRRRPGRLPGARPARATCSAAGRCRSCTTRTS